MLTRMAVAILAAVALCSGATAQSPTKVFRIGLVHVGAPGSCVLAPGFADAYARRGYIEGKNVTFERFAAEGRLERLPEAVDRMISHKVDLFVTCGYPAALIAAQRAPGIPVVVMNAGDPVETGMVDGSDIARRQPADLPLELPTRFHFSVNLKTAHSLGLTVPESIQLRADEVIE
jgi:ABC-type uncharacterized transport system substrate-binding protein